MTSDLPEALLKSYFSLRSNKNNRALCNAPFKNMQLGIDGNIIPCCFNREVKLGAFNSQSFNETWNSKIINEFRNELKEYRFPAGCSSCKEHFLSKNFQAMGARDYDIIPFRKEQPSELIFELSDECNFRCIMCKGSDYDWLAKIRGNTAVNDFNISFITDQMETILPRLYKVKFLGGEPFFIDAYYPIWEKIISVNPRCIIEVQTNGSILDDRTKKILEKGRFRIGVSIDSLDEDTYKNIRRGGNLQNVLKNIDFFHHYTIQKKTRLFFSFCPITLNWKEIPAIVNFCNSYNAHLFFNTVKTPKNISLFGIPAEKLEPVLAGYENSKLSSGSYIELINKRRYSEFIGELVRWHRQLLQSEKAQNDELDLLHKTPVSQFMTEMNARYNNYLNGTTVQGTIVAPFESISVKLLVSFPHDIYFKILLKYLLKLPKDKFETIFIKDFHEEFFKRFSNEYLKIKSDQDKFIMTIDELLQ